MDVKKEYMKLFLRNLYLNNKKSKKIKSELSEELDQILNKYDDDRVAFNEELKGAIPRALKATEQNAQYLEDMGLINAIKFSAKVPYLNIKSKMEIANLPVFHFTRGYNHKKKDYDQAKAIIAIGDKAKGVIAIGKLAYGLIAIGGISIGILSFGILSAGIFSAAGISFALLLALGGISISAIASLGVVALSSLAASGQIAMAHFVKTTQKVSTNIPGWFTIMADNIGMVLLIFEIVIFLIIIIIFCFDYISKLKYRK